MVRSVGSGECAAEGPNLRTSMLRADFCAAIAQSHSFYAPHSHCETSLATHSRGDPSADFALATFFPAPLVPAVERASDVIGRVTGLAAQAPTVLSADALGAPVLSEEAARRR